MEKILFVYNADKDPTSAAIGYAHKVFRPSTYPCELCELTYHNLGERKKWKSFRNEHGEAFEFLYIREFENRFTERFEYPVILFLEGESLSILMSKEEMKGCSTEDDLIKELKTKLKSA